MMNLMAGEKIELMAAQNFQSQSIAIYGRVCDKFDVTKALLTSVTITEVSSEFADTEPVLYLKRDAAQALMESLWQCGIRPSQAAGSIGQLAAVEKHLNDMRTLVFKSIGIDKP